MVLELNHREKAISKAFGFETDRRPLVEEFFHRNQGKPITLLIQSLWDNANNDNERAYFIFALGNLVGGNELAEKLIKEGVFDEKSEET